MENITPVAKSKSVDNAGLFFLIFSISLGGVVRFYPAMVSDFPLNDGGLFYQMTRDLLAHDFSLPFFTAYNGGAIPFSYPPLAFYLMAFLQRFLHIDIIDQLHYLPPLISTLTVPALYFLSKKITGSKEISIFAAFAYALMPHSYVWLIMGGGITRAFGILFGMLALLFVWEMFHAPRLSNLLLSFLFCSLTVYSHPEISWFVLLTAFLMGVWYGRNKRGILFAVLTILGVLLLTAPWWSKLIHRFGASIFLNGFQSGGFFNLSVLLFFFTGESFATLLAVLALFGLFAEIARKKFFLMVWLVMVSILSARSGQLLATIPGAVLSGIGMVDVLIPGLVSYRDRSPEEYRSLDVIFRERISKIAFSVIMVFALLSAMAAPFLGDSELKTLSIYDRQAMEWISLNSSNDSQFAILTGEPGWFADPISEWFPALTRRMSVSTAQGSEWLPGDQFQKNVDAYGTLQRCAENNYRCIGAWMEDSAIPFSYLYIRKPSMDDKLVANPPNDEAAPEPFRLVYENQGVRVYSLNGTP